MLDLRDSIENDLRRSDRESPGKKDLRATDERQEFSLQMARICRRQLANRERKILIRAWEKFKIVEIRSRLDIFQHIQLYVSN